MPKKKAKTKKEAEPAVLEEQVLTDEEMDDLRDNLDDMIVEHGGQIAPPTPFPEELTVRERYGDEAFIETGGEGANLSVQEAFMKAGMDPLYLAHKMKFLLSDRCVSPKWNPKTKKFEYFINGELWRRVIDMGIKVHGGYAAERQVSLHINADLKDILTSNSSPQDVNRQIVDYFQNFAREIGQVIEIEGEEVKE